LQNTKEKIVEEEANSRYARKKSINPPKWWNTR
jgi:hypothetical protein